MSLTTMYLHKKYCFHVVLQNSAIKVDYRDVMDRFSSMDRFKGWVKG